MTMEETLFGGLESFPFEFSIYILEFYLLVIRLSIVILIVGNIKTGGKELVFHCF